MEIRANAKLNLTLDVLGKREDGYHDLCMVMQSIDLSDRLTLELQPNEQITAKVDLQFIPHDDRNLAIKAAKAFFARVGRQTGVSIDICKKIPVCAGMAGGSTDAAAVLNALNQMLHTDLSYTELAEIGAEIGSDVPYCVWGGTVLAEGRGERLTALTALPFCHVVVCKPAFSISTPELFARLDAYKLVRRPDTAGMLAALKQGDLSDVARRMYNVFEDVLPDWQRKAVQEIKMIMIDEGALGSCMSGSGPTVFGLFDRLELAQNTYEQLKLQYEDTFLCCTVSGSKF